MSSVDPSGAAASPPDEQKDFYHFVYLSKTKLWWGDLSFYLLCLYTKTYDVTIHMKPFWQNFACYQFCFLGFKEKNFFKRIEGVIQFYSQRGKQIVLRKLGWENFHAININFCEVSWHLSALNFSCKSYILQPAVLNISESLDFTNYHSLKRCSPKLILLVNTGIQIRVQKYKTAFAQRTHYYFGMQLWT